MMNMLRGRRSPLLSIGALPSLQSHIDRYRHCGYQNVSCATLLGFYETTLPDEEVARVEALEEFDEFEEWAAMCSHYFLLAASSGTVSNCLDAMFPLNYEAFNELRVWTGRRSRDEIGCKSGSFPPVICAECTFITVIDLSWVCENDSAVGTVASQRYGHSATVVGQSLVVIGGASGERLGDVKIFKYVTEEVFKFCMNALTRLVDVTACFGRLLSASVPCCSPTRL